MIFVLATSILLALFPFANAIPAFRFAPIDTNPLGQPFINAILPVQPGSLLDLVCSAAKGVRICPSSVPVEDVAPMILPVAAVCAANQDICVREVQQQHHAVWRRPHRQMSVVVPMAM